jgi:hypothetical protein
MTRRYLPALLITAAVAILVVWIARNTYWEENDVPVWPKGEAAVNPFYAAQRFAELLGAHTQWRHEIAALPPQHAVVVAGVWNWNLIPSRRERLQQWVAAGGRLVVDHGLIGDERELERWTGVTWVPVDAEGKSAACRRNAPTCSNDSPCAGLDVDGTESVAARSRTRYTVCNFDATTRLTFGRKASWALRDDRGGIQALRVAIGRGSVTMINGWPFGNHYLFSGDHALLFTAATQLHRGEQVYFLSDDSGPALLGLMWSYGAPAIVLALTLVALWLWRSGVRFGPLAALPDMARRSLAEQIRGTGQFTMRFGGGQALHAAAARALREAAELHIAHYARLQSEHRIATLARLTALNPGELSEALNYAGPRRPSELLRTIALLESARRAVAGQTS